MRNASYLIYPVIIAVAMLAGFFIYEQRSEPAPSKVEMAMTLPDHERLEDFAYPSMITGDSDASITVIELMDYECPICISIHPTIKALRSKRDDIRFITLPLPVIGTESSMIKSTTAWTMAKLGKFQETHDAFMSNTSPFTQDDRLSHIAKYSITSESYEESFTAEHAHRQITLANRAEEIFGITATPSFLINGTPYMPEGELPTLTEFEAIIDAIVLGETP